jgi:predicted RNase H-like HicB family nuclease
MDNLRKIRVIYKKIDKTWHVTSPDLVRWFAGGMTLDEARKMAYEGVEFCLESKDFIIEEQFDSSVSA